MGPTASGPLGLSGVEKGINVLFPVRPGIGPREVTVIGLGGAGVHRADLEGPLPSGQGCPLRPCKTRPYPRRRLQGFC